jgi:hypothetical protein
MTMDDLLTGIFNIQQQRGRFGAQTWCHQALKLLGELYHMSTDVDVRHTIVKLEEPIHDYLEIIEMVKKGKDHRARTPKAIRDAVEHAGTRPTVVPLDASSEPAQ